MRTVFVSSTFKDMQAERDAIRDICAPVINEEARKHGDEIDFCDLRWGIDTAKMSEEESSLKVLDVCFSQIDRCQPPFVILSGYRYGWIPDADTVEKAVMNRHMELADLERSVTALEIEYGTVYRARPTFVYIREIVSDSIPAIYGSEDTYHQNKLRELKDRIAALPNTQIRTYTVHFEQGIPDKEDIRAFAQMLTEDLKNCMQEGWEAYDRQTPFERMVQTHWNYCEEKAGMFTARKDDAHRLYGMLKEDSRQTIICAGDSGSGKSTLLSYTAMRLREEGEHVLPIICGLTPQVTDAYGVLTMIEEYLCTRNGISYQKGDGSAELHQNNVRSLVSNLRENIYILIDAADQLYADEYRASLAFIPNDMPKNIHYLVTCTKDMKTDIVPAMVLDDLNDENKRQVISGILGYVQKELGISVKDHILYHSSAVLPLAIALIVQRLCIMDVTDFDIINSSSEEANKAIADRQKELIADMPQDLPALSGYVFNEVGKRIDPLLCKKIREYIAVSRYGMRVSDLIALCSSEWNSLNFAHYINYLYADFLIRSDGRYDFMHKSIRQGILLETDTARVNREIAVYMGTLQNTDPIKRSEYAYHLLKAGMYQEMHDYLMSIGKIHDFDRFYEAADSVYDLVMKEGTQPVLNYIRAVPSIKQMYMDLNFLCLFMEHPYSNNKQQAAALCELMEEVYRVVTENQLPRDALVRFMDKTCTTLYAYGYFAENEPLRRRYALKLLEFWKEHVNLSDIQEKACLFTAHYNALHALKGSSDEQELRQAEQIGLDAEKLLDSELIGHFDSQGIKTYTNLFGCMGEVYTRLRDPEKTEEYYIRDRQMRLENVTEDPVSALLERAACNMHMITVELMKQTQDLLKVYNYAKEMVEIFDTVKIPERNEAENLVYAMRAYMTAAQLFPLVHRNPSPEEERLYYSWNLKAMSFFRTAYRKYRQYSMYTRSISIHNNILKMPPCREESEDLCRKKVYEWLEEDKAALKQELCEENVTILVHTEEFLAVVLEKNKKNKDELIRLFTDMTEILEPIGPAVGNVYERLNVLYQNLYWSDPLLDDWQKHAYEYALKIGDDSLIRTVLCGIIESGVKSKAITMKIYAYCYALILWDRFKDLEEIPDEALGDALKAAINRSTLLGDLRPGDYRFMEYVEEHKKLFEKYQDKLDKKSLDSCRKLDTNQRGWFKQIRPGTERDTENALKKAWTAYHQDKNSETEAVLAHALKNAYLYVSSFEDKIISQVEEDGTRSCLLFANSLDATICPYKKDKVLFIAKKIQPAELTKMPFASQFVLDPIDGGEVLTLDEIRSLLARHGIRLEDCVGIPDTLYVRPAAGITKPISPMRSVILDSAVPELILTENNRERVQEAIHDYASHLKTDDVIAFLDTTRKSLFKTVPGGILFTEKSIEGSGVHIEYDKIASVDLVNKQLVFRYGSGLKITMDYNDPKGIVRKLIAEYMKQKKA